LLGHEVAFAATQDRRPSVILWLGGAPTLTHCSSCPGQTQCAPSWPSAGPPPCQRALVRSVGLQAIQSRSSVMIKSSAIVNRRLQWGEHTSGHGLAPRRCVPLTRAMVLHAGVARSEVIKLCTCFISINQLHCCVHIDHAMLLCPSATPPRSTPTGGVVSVEAQPETPLPPARAE
jgi:hypothetical protein